MDITCISDLHGHYPKLEGGDLLIVAGDLTEKDDKDEDVKFYSWLLNQEYRKKIFICGNHDTFFQRFPFFHTFTSEVEYLCDSGTEFEGLKIWGSPWTKSFEGMNPKCKAFTVDSDEELAEKWDLIPDDTDILITHCPPWGMLDGPDPETRYGSKSLLRWKVAHLQSLSLHVFGHIHEGYGVFDIRKAQDAVGEKRITVNINASIMDECYDPVNKPIRVIL